MPTLPKPLFRGAATTNTATTLYTVPASTTTMVTDIVVATTGTARTFTLSLNDVAIATAVSVPANSIASFSIKQALTAGQTIKGGASATDVTIHISGVEVS